MGAQQKLTSSYGINDHVYVHTILRSHRYMVPTRAQWDVITKPRFYLFSPFLFFFGCPSGGPVNVRADSDSESEQPILQSGARPRWQRRRADVDRREDATVLLDRDAVNEVKDGVQLHCIQCTINVHVCHGGEW